MFKYYRLIENFFIRPNHVRHAQGIKRKWQQLTGQPVPKRLRTDDFQMQQDADAAASKQPPRTVTKTAVEPAWPKTVVKTAVEPAWTKPHDSPQTAVAKKSKPTGANGSEPSIDAINSMSYNEIRKELKRRGIGQ